MSPEKLLAERSTDAATALARVRSGARVFVGSGCAEPQSLVRALCARADALHDVEVVHLLTLGIADYVDADFMGNFRHNAFFIGPNVRAAVAEGRADYTPIFLSEIPRLIRSRQRPVDVALVQVGPPDRHGFCSLGIHVDVQRAAIEAAHLVIAEINPRMPRTLGDAPVHLSRFDAVVPVDAPLLELPGDATAESEITRQIADHVARLVDHGACLQMGIGDVPNAVLRRLKDKRDLGVHTEMFSDGLIELVENGNVTNRRKTVRTGQVVTSFVMGSRRLYDFVDDNPSIVFGTSDFVNDPRVIAQNDGVVAINSALQVDLTGQVCADSIGYRFFSGIGGQVDFVRGAAMSRGGKPIIAMPSTARNGTLSRIVPHLDEGAGVVTSRGDVHYVVTEHGVAHLHGKTIRERALALISIAHPDWRRELLDFVVKRHYVMPDERVGEQLGHRYPAELEHRRDFGGTELAIRPLRATDERLLQEFFYSHDEETIYLRYFTPKRALSHEEAAALCCVDYDQTMALGVFEVDGPGETLVAVGRYMRDPGRPLAETAFIVHERFRRRGIALYLRRMLERYAAAHGIEGFCAEILPQNFGMIATHRRLGHHIGWVPGGGVYRVEYRFDEAATPAAEGQP